MSGQALPPAIHFVSNARVADTLVRLRDVADLSGLPAPLRQRAGPLVVATIAERAASASFRVDTLRSHARATLPALAPWMPRAADPSVVRVAVVKAAGVAPSRACAVVTSYVAAGQTVTADDLRPAECPTTRTPGLRYSANRASAYAAEALSPGQIIAAPGAGVVARKAAGQAVTLVAKLGVVTVERDVEAVQPLAPGHGVFVRADDGRVFAAAAGEIAP